MNDQNEKPLSIAEVYELTPGDQDNATWINAGVHAVVRKLEKKTGGRSGKTIWRCTLGDPTGHVSVAMAVFQPPRFAEGDEIEITGQGIRRTEYKGAAQIETGKSTEIHVLGHSAHHDEQQTREAQSAPALDGQPFAVPGQTVGMAIKEAINLRQQTIHPEEREDTLEDPSFWKGVYTTASDIIRLSRLLEKGNLAQAVKIRADPEAAKQQAEAETAAQREAEEAEQQRIAAAEEKKRRAAAQPGPGGQAFVPDDAPDDQIPF